MDLLRVLKEKGMRPTLNQKGAYLLLTYGLTFENVSITREITRFMVGNCMVIEN